MPLHIEQNGYYNVNINSSDTIHNNKYLGWSSGNNINSPLNLRSWPNLSDPFKYCGPVYILKIEIGLNNV